ncbi:MAG: Rrf2 family transcriptional regulator [Nevskia sp.]|nr:Rrf2 family transcriptional regulator [Nevskia sp.]
MRLSLHTDFSLRLLVFLAANVEGKPIGAARIAERFKVSGHHMQKVAQTLRRLGYVTSRSGRQGGLALARPAETVRVGDVVEALEGRGQMADCRRGPCLFLGACALKVALDRAERGFIDDLRRYTIADVIRGPMRVQLDGLLRAA